MRPKAIENLAAINVREVKRIAEEKERNQSIGNVVKWIEAPFYGNIYRTLMRSNLTMMGLRRVEKYVTPVFPACDRNAR